VGIGAVLFVASWSVAGDRSGRPIQVAAESGETGTSRPPAGPDQGVLFGSYSCRVAPGVSINLLVDFSSTGGLAPAPAAGVNGDTTFFFPTLKTENQILGDVNRPGFSGDRFS
jgi:hypothetical protein